MIDILINGLSCNNSSSQVVLKSHIQNILQLKNNISIRICLSRRQSLLWQAYGNTLSVLVRPIIFPDWIFSLPLPRWIIHSFFFSLYALCLQPRSILLSNGYPLPIFFIRQVVICQNPVPFLCERRLYLCQNFLKLIINTLKAMPVLLFHKYLQWAAVSRFFSLGYVFNSSYMHSLYSRVSAVPVEWRVAHNPVHLDDAKSKALVAQAPYRDTSFTILSIAPLVPYKRVDIVVKSVTMLMQSLPDCLIKFISVGKSPDKTHLASIKSSIPQSISENFIFITNFISDSELSSFYRQSDVYCSMSCYESFGLPAVEAQGYGIPVVLYKHTAASEICCSGSIFCDKPDYLELHNILLDLVSSPGKWSKLSSEALVNSQRFSSPQVSGGLLALLELP